MTRMQITRAIPHWFAPPELPSTTLSRHARALWLVSWPFFAVVTVMLAIAVFLEPSTLARRTGTVLAVGTLVAGLHGVSRRGRPILASWIFVLGITVIVTQRAWITGGIHSGVELFYALFICMAGVLLGARAGVVIALASFIGATVLLVGEELSLLQPVAGAGSPFFAYVWVAFAIGIALALQGLVSFRSRHQELGVHAVQMFVHDMRSPLQVVLAHLELLRDEVTSEGASSVAGAIDGATNLHRLTTSLLDVSRLEAGSMPIRHVHTDLLALASSVVSSIQVLQPTRALSVESTGSITVRCDPDLMRRVLENLVINALKHTEIESRVRVVLSGAEESLRIAVLDEGAGVPAEKRARMFNLFGAEGVRTESGYESHGLGLAFCRLAVEAHGGTIRVEGGEPRGTVFVVELPR